MMDIVERVERRLRLGKDFAPEPVRELVDECNSARSIARRLLRERDEARDMAERTEKNNCIYRGNLQNIIELNETLQSQVKRYEKYSGEARAVMAENRLLTRTVEEQRKRYDAKCAEWSAAQAESSRRGAEMRELRSVIEQVEWERVQRPYVDECMFICPWCGGNSRHEPDCQRQRALGKA